MGGSVDVESELGKGSCFNINIKTKCKVKRKLSHQKNSGLSQ
jgi:chemotaxis protein histidine kinase CheA